MDGIVVADDDGEVLDGPERCEHCGQPLASDDVPTVQIPSAVLARCRRCGRWSELNR